MQRSQGASEDQPGASVAGAQGGRPGEEEGKNFGGGRGRARPPQGCVLGGSRGLRQGKHMIRSTCLKAHPVCVLENNGPKRRQEAQRRGYAASVGERGWVLGSGGKWREEEESRGSQGICTV